MTDTLPNALSPPPSAERIPRAALVLGGTGAIPFLASAALTVAGPQSVSSFAAKALLAYGAVILSFLGGIHWGLAIRQRPGGEPAPDTSTALALSVAPSLIGWVALLLDPRAGMILLAAAFALWLAIDLARAPRLGAPRWYPRLRWPLTGAAISSLLICGLIV